MSILNYNTKPIDGATKPVDEQPVESDTASLTPSKRDELTASASPEKIIESHLFVADGQECICLKDTIPPKTRTSSMPREKH